MSIAAMPPATDLDEIDKSIITALQRDGRRPYSQLGADIGLSEAATRQRVIRLIDRGVMQIVAVTDPTKIGLPVHAMVGITIEGDIDAVADRLAADPVFDYVVVTAGRFDMLVELVCADTDDLLAVVNTRIRNVSGVRTCEIMSYLRLVKQTYNWGTG